MQTFASQHLNEDQPTQGNFVVLRSTSNNSIGEENSDEENPLNDAVPQGQAAQSANREESEAREIEIPLRRGGRRTTRKKAAEKKVKKVQSIDLEPLGKSELQMDTATPERSEGDGSGSNGQDERKSSEKSKASTRSRGKEEAADDSCKITAGAKPDDLEDESKDKENILPREEMSNREMEIDAESSGARSSKSRIQEFPASIPGTESASVVPDTSSATPQKPAFSTTFNTPKIYPSLSKFKPEEETEDEQMEEAESSNQIKSDPRDDTQSDRENMIGSFPQQSTEESYSFISHPRQHQSYNQTTSYSSPPNKRSSNVPTRSSSLADNLAEFGAGEGARLTKSNSASSISSLASTITSSLRKKAEKLFSGSLSRKRGIEQVEDEEVEEQNEVQEEAPKVLLDGKPFEFNSSMFTDAERERLNLDAPDSPQSIRIIKPRPSRGGRGSTSSNISPAKPTFAITSSPLRPAISEAPSTSISASASATAAVLAEMNLRLAAAGKSTSNLTASGSGLTWDKPAAQNPRFQLPKSFSSLKFDGVHDKQFSKLDGIDKHYAAQRNASTSSNPITKRLKTQETKTQEISEAEKRKRERALNAARRKDGLKVLTEKEKAKERAKKALAATSKDPATKKKAGLGRFTDAIKDMFGSTSQASASTTTAKISSSTAKVIRPSDSLSSRPSGSISSKPSNSLLSGKDSTSGSSRPSSLISSRSSASIGPSSRTTSSRSTRQEKPKFDLQASLRKTPVGYKPYSAKEALEGLKAEREASETGSVNKSQSFNFSPTKIPSPINSNFKLDPSMASSQSSLKFPTRPESSTSRGTTSSTKPLPPILSPATRRPRIDHNRLFNKKRDAQTLAQAQILSKLKVPSEMGPTSSNPEALPPTPNIFQTSTTKTSVPVSRPKTGKTRSSISASAHNGMRKAVVSGVKKGRIGGA